MVKFSSYTSGWVYVKRGKRVCINEVNLNFISELTKQ
jgi:hypothetical protein